MKTYKVTYMQTKKPVWSQYEPTVIDGIENMSCIERFRVVEAPNKSLVKHVLAVEITQDMNGICILPHQIAELIDDAISNIKEIQEVDKVTC